MSRKLGPWAVDVAYWPQHSGPFGPMGGRVTETVTVDAADASEAVSKAALSLDEAARSVLVLRVRRVAG